MVVTHAGRPATGRIMWQCAHRQCGSQHVIWNLWWTTWQVYTGIPDAGAGTIWHGVFIMGTDVANCLFRHWRRFQRGQACTPATPVWHHEPEKARRTRSVVSEFRGRIRRSAWWFCISPFCFYPESPSNDRVGAINRGGGGGGVGGRPFHKLPKIFSEVAKINPKSCRKVANISEKLPKSC